MEKEFLKTVNMTDPVQKRFGYGCYGQRAAKISLDCICQIRLPASISVLFFQLKICDDIAQNQSECNLDGLVRVWSNASGLEAGRCTGIIWLGFWLDTTGPLPVFHLQTWFRTSTDIPDNLVQNQPGSDLVLADCVRFWPDSSGPEASQCARIIGPLLANASEPIRTGCKWDLVCLLGIKMPEGCLCQDWRQKDRVFLTKNGCRVIRPCLWHTVIVCRSVQSRTSWSETTATDQQKNIGNI